MNILKEKILSYHIGREKLIYTGKRTRIITKLSSSKEFTTTKLYEEIMKNTSFLPNDLNLFMRLKCILQGVTHIELCPICQKNKQILQNYNMNEDFFSSTCGSHSCIAKLSRINCNVSEETRNKHSIAQKNLRKTYLNVYRNIANIFISEKYTKIPIDIIKETLIQKINERYSVSSILSDTFLKNNIDFVCSILNNTRFILLNDIESKCDLKLNERIFCIMNGLNSVPKCKFCDNAAKFISFKHGYSISCKNCISEKIRQTKNYPTLLEMHDLVDKNKYEIIQFPKYTDTEKLVIKCKQCGSISSHYIYNGRGKNLSYMNLCNNCEKYQSSYENKLNSFIRDLGFNTVLHDRELISPYELDILIPEKMIAVEIDGAYWHDSDIVGKKYHMIKTDLCLKKGFQLIHIFENELLKKENIVLSRLSNILGISEKKIYARSCDVKIIDSHISKRFQEDNHCQGYAQSSLNIGLLYNGILISLMTFGKSRFNKKYEWELIRFCSKINYCIIGGASKLLNFFEQLTNPQSLISYADRRWSNGRLYEKLGMQFIGKTIPNYWYFNKSSKELFNRICFQKHKLKNILPLYDVNLSESENMKNNGFIKIYDCGNLVFVKKYT